MSRTARVAALASVLFCLPGLAPADSMRAIGAWMPSMAPTPAASGTRLGTEAAFRDAVVDRSLTTGDFTRVIAADGTVTGTDGADAVRGRWLWQAGRYCRNLRVATDVTGTRCAEVWLSTSGNVRFIDRIENGGTSVATRN